MPAKQKISFFPTLSLFFLSQYFSFSKLAVLDEKRENKKCETFDQNE